jgi:hypothetical protein
MDLMFNHFRSEIDMGEAGCRRTPFQRGPQGQLSRQGKAVVLAVSTDGLA